MIDLDRYLFVLRPTRIAGRFGLAITRALVRPQVYKATGLWTSWEFLCVRLYWWQR